MEPDIFMDDFERTLYGDDFYSVVGRALTISVRFEALCKSLNTLLKLKSEHETLESEEDINEVVKAINGLGLQNQIDQIAKGRRNKELRNILNDAKDARNEIVHEIALGLDRHIDSIPQAETDSIKTRLKQLIEDIAIADKIVSFIASKISNEPIPCKEFLESYSDKIKCWVFGDECKQLSL